MGVQVGFVGFKSPEYLSGNISVSAFKYKDGVLVLNHTWKEDLQIISKEAVGHDRISILF